MVWTDSHCHLHNPWFPELDDIVQRAKEGGTKYIVNCSSDPRSNQDVMQSIKFENMYATIGIQPTIASDFLEKNLFEYFSEFLSKKMVAIGEVGLDYYWVKEESQREMQRIVFKEIVKVANDLDLPLVIHSRKAESDCLDILEKEAEVPVLLHSFDGNLKETRRAIDLGFYVSIPTNVVIRKNRRKTAKRVGIDRILLETDSPFCAPSNEIERNEPYYISTAGKYIATLLELDVKEVEDLTTRNARAFYGF